MNLIKIVSKYYLENDWCCGDTYESLEWYDTIKPKPTYEELEQLWTLYLEDEMREKRNKLLQESDFRALPDYPGRDKWINYRQELRDFPSIWAVDIPFPIQPE